MSLMATLKADMKEAMKAKDKVKLDTVRGLISALQYEEMQKETDELPDASVLAILKSERKKRLEQVEFAEKSERGELLEQAKLELEIIDGYLPKQLSEDELSGIVKELYSKDDSQNMGQIMKALKDSYDGQYDGKLASAIVRGVLNRG